MLSILSKNLRIVVTGGIILLLPHLGKTQQLSDYIQEGLKSNLVLQQKNISLQQAQQSLKIAQRYFLPTVSVLADYTSGDGGRSISLPIGDLLNPVYTSLNQVTQSDAFQMVENVNENFFPKNFYDARVRTSVPLINTDLLIQKDIQSQQVLLKQYELEIYQRELIRDIKTAYYTIMAADDAVKIYESAFRLVEQNVFVNESLLRNGKSLPASVLRSKSEQARVASELNNARNQVINARQYFNFLLNRDLDQPVNTTEIPYDNIAFDTVSIETDQREERFMIKSLQEINRASIKMSQLSRLPRINAFLDLGTQASDFEFNNDSRYYLVGVQFSFPIFQGFRNSITIRQNKLELQKTEQHLDYTNQQLHLAASRSKNQLQTTLQNYHAAGEQLKSAQSYFNLVDKGYKEGINSLIEFLDARTQLTSSQLQLNLRQLEVLTAHANLERETASYSFNN